MKVSLITATYNSAETVCDAISSVRSQSYSEIEHVFIDGLSQDDTLKLIQREAGASSVIISEPDSGIYDALNKGLDLASGDVVGFLHSDDYLCDAYAIAKIVAELQKTEADAVYSDLKYVSRRQGNKPVRLWRAGRFSRNKLSNGWMPPHPTLFVRQKLMQRYRFNTDYRISADYDMCLRLFSTKSIVASYIPEVLVAMRTGGASNKNLKNLKIKSTEDYRIATEHGFNPVRAVLMKNLRKLPQIFR